MTGVLYIDGKKGLIWAIGQNPHKIQRSGIDDMMVPKRWQANDRGRISKVLEYLEWAIPNWHVSIFKCVTVRFPKKVVQKFPSHRIRTNTFEGAKCYTQISSLKNCDLESWIR